MLNGTKVALTTDLTKYGDGLVVGIQGVVCDPTTMWKTMGAIGVKFTNGIQLDVFPKSLKVVD